jgi:hypothetical protein
MKLISILILIAALLAAVPFSDEAQARGCSRAGRFSLTSTGPWPMRLNARENETCGANFSSHGPMIFKRLYLVTPPQHGTIKLIEGGRYRYSTPAGYRGPDAFQLRVCGNQNGYDGCADLQYAVTVN